MLDNVISHQRVQVVEKKNMGYQQYINECGKKIADIENAKEEYEKGAASLISQVRRHDVSHSALTMYEFKGAAPKCRFLKLPYYTANVFHSSSSSLVMQVEQMQKQRQEKESEYNQVDKEMEKLNATLEEVSRSKTMK